MLIGPDDLDGLRTAADDYEETETLKYQLADLYAHRDPFYLTREELEPIFRWKLGTQYGRNQTIRNENSDEAYEVVTQAAFQVNGPTINYELRLRTGILIALRGVEVPVASAILALVDPDSYCVIDFRGWRSGYGQDKKNFTIPQYLHYRNDVAEIANTLNWSVQETDLAIWTYDKRTHT